MEYELPAEMKVNKLKNLKIGKPVHVKRLKNIQKRKYTSMLSNPDNDTDQPTPKTLKWDVHYTKGYTYKTNSLYHTHLRAQN